MELSEWRLNGVLMEHHKYYIVETMRFFFGYPLILFYAFLRDHKKLREILNLKVLKSFSNYEDFRKKLHKLKVRINSITKEC